MEERINVLLGRRSIRHFEDTPITADELNAVLEAGMYAPSAMNEHRCKFVVFQRSGALQEVIKAMNGDPFHGAPTMIAVFVDKLAHTPIQDGSLALGNMLNAAHMLGLGSCWVNSTVNFFEGLEGNMLKIKYLIPSDYNCVGSCVLGYIRGNIPKPLAKPKDMIVLTD